MVILIILVALTLKAPTSTLIFRIATSAPIALVRIIIRNTFGFAEKLKKKKRKFHRNKLNSTQNWRSAIKTRLPDHRAAAVVLTGTRLAPPATQMLAASSANSCPLETATKTYERPLPRNRKPTRIAEQLPRNRLGSNRLDAKTSAQIRREPIVHKGTIDRSCILSATFNPAPRPQNAAGKNDRVLRRWLNDEGGESRNRNRKITTRITATRGNLGFITRFD